MWWKSTRGQDATPLHGLGSHRTLCQAASKGHAGSIEGFDYRPTYHAYNTQTTKSKVQFHWQKIAVLLETCCGIGRKDVLHPMFNTHRARLH